MNGIHFALLNYVFIYGTVKSTKGFFMQKNEKKNQLDAPIMCECSYCGDVFKKSELRPKHYERNLLVCENCYEADRNEEEDE